MEYNAWGDPKNPPEHEANLVFTRMLSRPDGLHARGPEPQGQGRYADPLDAGEAAGALHRHLFADPDGCRPARELRGESRRPSSSSRMSPSTGTTRACSPARSAILRCSPARRAARPSGSSAPSATSRSAISTSRSSFLDRAVATKREIYRDGDDADYRTNPRSIVIEKRIVTSNDRLAERIAPGGGTAVRFVPIGR